MDKQKRYFSSYDNTLIYYEITGEGFPLLLLHGNNGNLRYFDQEIDLLSKKYKVIAIDSRGHGLSGNNQTNLTFDMMAKDVILLMEKEKIEKANVIGFSDGGVLALAVALLRPEILKKMVINSPNLTPEDLKIGTRIISYLAYYIMFFLGLFSRKLNRIKLNLSLIVKPSGINWQDLKKIEIPNLVIMGEKDSIIKEHIQAIADTLPQGYFCWIPNGKHSLLQSNEKEFNEVVLSFFKEEREEMNAAD